MITAPTVYNQQLPDCFIFPALTAFQVLLSKAGHEVWTPSSRFVLACWRADQSGKGRLQDQTNGGALRTIKKYGVCREESYPYNTHLPQKEFYQLPPKEVMAEAKQYAGISYRRVDKNRRVITSWVEKGYPVLFAWETSVEALKDIGKGGVHRSPRKGEKKFYHSGAIIGFDGSYFVLNSYGPKWGANGCFIIPPKHVLAGIDFWVMDALTSKPTERTTA